MATLKLSNDFSKGLLKNFNNLKHDKDFYSFAFNISPVDNILDRTTKQNEKSDTIKLSLHSQDYYIVGEQHLGRDEYVFFISDLEGSGFNQILLVKDNTITVKYDSIELNISPENIIKSTYRVNLRGERLIYFVDGYNDDRVINIDTLELTDLVNSFSLNPVYGTIPELSSTVISNGGFLKAGEYSILVSFKDKNLKQSLEKSQLNNIPIGDGDYEEFSKINTNTLDPYELIKFQNDAYNTSVKGLTGGERTNKSIEITIKDLNSDNYPFLDIYIIRRESTDTEVLLLEDYPSSKIITITGGEDFQSLGNELSSIIVSNINYNRSHSITQFNNRLVRGNVFLTENQESFQEIANNITVTFKTQEVRAVRNLNGYDTIAQATGKLEYPSVYRNFMGSMKSFNMSPNYLANSNNKELPLQYDRGTFMRDEVYALGVYFELEDGSFTDVFHIPGRALNTFPNNGPQSGNSESGRQLTSSNKSTYDSANFPNTNIPYWEETNTSVLSVDRGQLGYYRTDSSYPKGYNFPTDGEKDSNGDSYIRHHRMPSEKLVPSFKLKEENSDIGKPNTLYKVNILLEFRLPDIPVEILGKIKNVFYTSAKRTETNKKVIGHGLAYRMSNSNITGDNTIYSSFDLSAPFMRFGEPSSEHKLNNSFYEFISPEIDYKFKESSVNGYKIKPNYLVSSRTLYFSRAEYQDLDSLRSLVINPKVSNDNYKEAFVGSHSYYSNITSLNSFKQFDLLGVSFSDSNSQGSLNGSYVSRIGGQNSLVIRVEDPNPNTNMGYTESDLGVSSFYHLCNQTGSETKFEDYYDSNMLCTILTNNTNIFYNINSLEYNTLFKYEYGIQTISTVFGDAYIENHKSKKSSKRILDSLTLGDDYPSDYVYIHEAEDKDEYGLTVATQAINVNNYIEFPVNTFINIRMAQETENTNPYLKILNSIHPVEEANKYADQYIEYIIDPVFLRQDSIVPMFANSVKVDNIGKRSRLNSRIVYSELQNLESEADSYRDTKANNYKDLPSHKGFITSMFEYNGNLYAVTRDSIFILYASQSQLQVSSGEQITIGTGDFLSGGMQELVSSENGFGGSSSKLGVVETPYGVIVVDILRDRILRISNDGVEDLNNSGLNEIFKTEFIEKLNLDFDNPLLSQGVTVGFDPKLHRILITSNKFKTLGTLYNPLEKDYNNSAKYENKSFTISYDPLLKTWISYHDYFPRRYIQGDSEILLNKKDLNTFDNNYKGDFIIETVFNEHPKDNKVFDSLEFGLVSEENQEINKKFFEKLIAYNDNQTTGEILFSNNNIAKREDLFKINGLLNISKDIFPIKLFNGDWNSIKDNFFIDKVINTNIIDNNKHWYNKNRLRSPYLKVRLFGDKDDKSKKILNYMNANVRNSIR